MFISMREFQAQKPSYHRPINCFVGSSASGKTTTAVMCTNFLFIPSVTTRAKRKGEAPRIDLEDFMFQLYGGTPLLPITTKFALQEYIHASPEEFKSLDKKGQFLWTYTSSGGNQYGTLKVLVQAALTPNAEPSIIIVSPDAAIRLATIHAPGKVNCFYFESPDQRMQILRARETKESMAFRLKEEASWRRQVEESNVQFVRIPADPKPWKKAQFIKETTGAR